MLRYLLSTLFLLSCLVFGHHAHAALSSEAQQIKEEDAIRESKELKGHVIHDITMHEEDGTRYYQVEADCIYEFVVEYHQNLLALLGWVGPKKFSVEIYGEPNCQNLKVARQNQGDLQTNIYGYISKIYKLPVNAIGPNMSLYHIPTGQEKAGMDFRIIALRQRLEERANCRINSDLFMTIRTVNDLLILTHQYCGSSK